MKYFIYKYKSSGFTLIELLIVIAVIGGLAAIVTTTFPSANKRARDANRKSDIKQYQTAMEVYYNKNNAYYVTSGTPASGGACGATALNLPNCAKDPKSGWNYTVNSTASSYVIYAQLESPADSTKNYFVVCSDGRAGECASPGANTSCSGSCP